MRADRLVAALLLLQARGRVTAAELATELEVSVATARRDLEALSTAGLPVYPQPGRRGGWSLLGGARTDLSGLTSAEARALFLLIGPSAAVSGEAKAALRKLVRALPATFRAEARAAAESTVIDPAAWGGRDRAVRPAAVTALQQAVVRQRTISFGYQGSVRRADPYGVVGKNDAWYVIAGTSRGRRTFRVDRMTDVTPTDATFTRPENFDLDAEWSGVVDAMEARRAATWATVLIPERFVWVLRHHFGRHCTPGETLPDGRTEVRVGAPTPRDIARTLSGWGATVEVLDPPSVRAELSRIGAELAAAYPSHGATPEH